ncbi:3244_t:CDS:1, partial [Dentiscutata heterogama]
QQKLDNLTYYCSCNKTQIEAKRLDYYSRCKTHYCYQCLTLQTPDKLYLLDNQLTCTVCYKIFHKELELNNPCSQEYYQNRLGRGLLSIVKFVIIRNLEQKYID